MSAAAAAVAQCLDENVRNYIVCVPLHRGVHTLTTVAAAMVAPIL